MMTIAMMVAVLCLVLFAVPGTALASVSRVLLPTHFFRTSEQPLPLGGNGRTLGIGSDVQSLALVVRLVSSPTTVHPGEGWTLTAQTQPDANCTLGIFRDGILYGPAASNRNRVADDSGRVTWTFTAMSDLGQRVVKVTCLVGTHAGSLQTSFEIAPASNFGSPTVWEVPIQVLNRMCPNHGQVDCVANAMVRLGASPSAVDFFRFTRAFLMTYRSMGRVSLGQAEFPWAANDNVALVMLNGAPPAVWAGGGIGPGDLQRAPEYRQIQRRFAQLRLSANTPRFEQMSRDAAGGQLFLFEIPLVNGCHACTTNYVARVAYYFAADGTYIAPPRVRNLCARTRIGGEGAGAPALCPTTTSATK